MTATVLPRFAAVRPSAVRPCAATEDVAEALAVARRAGRPVAVRSGGHSFAGRSTTTGVVIDVSPMSGVRVDGDVAVIGAGTRLAEVYARLAAHGRTLPAGCGATVGISGLTLGGGLGILGRRHGLTSDHLLAATLVRSDGRPVEADDDLLWTLRGGGAPGVVTSLTFRTVAVPTSTAFRLTFPPGAAADLLDAWQATLPTLADSVSPSLLITASSAPAPSSGPAASSAPAASRTAVTASRERLSVAVFGAAPDGGAVDDLIARLGARPSSDDRRHGTHLETKRWLAADDSVDPRWAYLHSEFFRDPVRAPALLERLTFDRRPGEDRELDFSPWGGAYNRVPADATAFPHRAARFLLKQTATVAPGDHPGPWLDDSNALTRPHGTGGAYPNFPDPSVPVEAYYLANTARRARIRAEHDPDALFGP
jgi:FAD/FMN-containing dehydrogenase